MKRERDVPLFAFEVATSRGVVRVIGPTLPADEAQKITARVGRVLELIIIDPEETEKTPDDAP